MDRTTNELLADIANAIKDGQRLTPVTFRRRDVEPVGLYVSGDSALQLAVMSNTANVDIIIQGHMATSEGTVIPFRERVTTDANRTLGVTTVKLIEGFLLGFSVVSETAATPYGGVWAAVSLVKGTNTNPLRVSLLAAGAVSQAARVGWPGNSYGGPVRGQGHLRSVATAAPAAGAESITTVPTGARWRPMTFRVQLVASAAAANRRVHIVYDDGATICLDMAAADLVTAGLTRNVNHGQDGFARATQDNEIYIPAPTGIVLPAASRIRTLTTAIDAGDQYGAAQLLVEEWLDL